MALRLLQSPSYQSRLPARLRGYTRGTHTKAEIDAAARQLVTLRRRSAGYIRAGWIKAAQDFGGAAKRKVSAKSFAALGRGTRATESRLAASGTNAATGALAVGSEPLRRALDFVGRDMIAYAERKLAKAWK